MQVPGVRQNEERPAGVVPRNVHFLIMGGIALLIALATFWSGNKPRKPEEKAPTVGPTPNQLQNFKQVLEQQRRDAEQDAERRQQRLREAQALQANAVAAPPTAPTATALPDPIAEQNLKRAAAAPFASNYVVRPPTEVPTEKPSIDTTTQIVFPGEIKGVDTKQPASKPNNPDAPKESGRRLPLKDGDLFRLFEGTLVHSTLVNRLDGSFTGPVNCVVSVPVLSENEGTVLIPKGSRFLGKASRVEAENQTRLAVTFKRLILPNGYSIDLEAAPGLDSAGESGLKGNVNNHNFRKFGLAGAVGLLGGLALYGGQSNPYAAGVANSTGSSATNILGHYLNAVPTITIPQGHPVNIYLPGDLLLPEYRP